MDSKQKDRLMTLMIMLNILVAGYVAYEYLWEQTIRTNNIQAPHSYTGTLTDDTIGMHLSGNISYGLALGSSMQPTIYEGNTGLLQEYDGRNLKPGEIIRFKVYDENHTTCESLEGWVANNTVIHRVNANYRNYIQTIGDNGRNPEKIEKCQITHVVIGVLYT